MLLRFRDFMNEGEIEQLLADNDAKLSHAGFLIIDLRGNAGGNSSAYEHLLKYCLPNGKAVRDMGLAADGALSRGVEINYTERNCDVRMELVNDMLQSGFSAQTRDFLTAYLSELKEMRGRGFVKRTEALDPEIRGNSEAEKVYIITDGKCVSAGESAVYLFKMFPKVTVIGQPTAGILDYSNVTYALFDPYALVYPTSRLLALDDGRRMAGKGVCVDTYIPWTPEHLTRDVELDYILSEIRSKNGLG